MILKLKCSNYLDDEAQRAELAARLEDLRKEVNGVEPPHEFLCPITHQLMRDPVIATGWLMTVIRYQNILR